MKTKGCPGNIGMAFFIIFNRGRKYLPGTVPFTLPLSIPGQLMNNESQ